MITGFNTDVEFQGTTYHVQTEDKGLATPFVLSLVYDRGTILASKRSPYGDLVENDFDEKVLAERLQKQHKTICAAIRAGKIEQLKEMTVKESAARRKKAELAKNSVKTAPENNSVEAVKTEISFNKIPNSSAEQKPDSFSATKIGKQTSVISQNHIIQTEKPAVQNVADKISFYKGIESPIPKPKYDFSIESVPAGVEAEPQTFAGQKPQIEENELVIEVVEIIEEELILPAEAVEIVTETVSGKSADNKLNLEILGDDIFKSGEKKTMSILVHRGGRQNGLSEAQVMVKVLGAAFRPLIFHGKTDQQGVAKVHLQMPLFKQGRAAILIKAMSEGEEIELRRTIKHK
ncbi:MAG: hypothetical protein ABIP06_09400 [Pyrinomonadaceae bacterium]